ncbi:MULTISPECIES: hypothetical protein [Haloferax]|jgi:hypothetical protein|uniref:Uncharacterized protein n=5 Tax=Haloferax TaxID=2251 RepID=D4GY24_HALVD|nr:MULTISPECIES: hypothetical protein [Haloferax]ADB79729.1 unknown [Haloferax lucentense DSM 14919]ADE04790.1 hypothetical protein HVO_1430 [Haloferax volcanii DS2]ELK53881.1 hypothetical protein D320_11860 [Haloferax sp. BAB-2207]ELY28332.1 hypothetical protein C498_11581 [Haloferax volcanii DS2]MBS8117866.1 hypothetical protein [Haloferax volcanii]
MLLWFLKQLPIGTIAGAVVLAGALQLAGIDLVGMGSDLLLDLLGVPDWSGDWFGSLL